MSSTNIYTPYCYLIGWSHLNLWYYGVRYSKNCHPTDLWKTYFTSSTYVKQARIEYGDPDVVEIRKTFSSAIKAKTWEQTVLRRIKHRDKFLNKCFVGLPDIVMTDEIRAKISNTKTGTILGKYYTDGINNILVKSDDEIPIGYKPGKTISESQLKSCENARKIGVSDNSKIKRKETWNSKMQSDYVHPNTGKSRAIWISNDSIKTSTQIKLGEEIPHGWYRGRKYGIHTQK